MNFFIFSKVTLAESILCIKCNCWVRRRFSGIRKCLSKAVDTVSRKCCGFTSCIIADKEVTLDDDVIEMWRSSRILEMFFASEKECKKLSVQCLLVELHEKSFKNTTVVMCKRTSSLKLKESMYKSCVRSALYYGAE